tara:strand:+ start:561 stop:878 length:318 start_codon:yes stop_codon:yes gene_type:complete
MGFLSPDPPPPPPPAPPPVAVRPVVDVADRKVDPYDPITEDDLAEGETVRPDASTAASSEEAKERRRLARKRGKYGKATILTSPQGLLDDAPVMRPTLIGGARAA